MARLIKGIGYGTEEQLVSPGNGSYWTRSTDGHPMYTSPAGINYDLLAMPGADEVPTTFSGNVSRPEQPFPTSLAGLQSFFPGATSAKIYTFNEAAGNIIEQTGSGQDLSPEGVPKYGLWTPFSPVTVPVKKSCSAIANPDDFLGFNGASLDPAGAACSMLFVLRRNAAPTAGYVIDKYNGAGYLVYMQSQTYHILVRDGAIGAFVDLAMVEYSTGAYTYLLWNFDGLSTFQIMTTEEVVTSAVPAFTAAGFTNAIQAKVLNNQANTLPLLGNIAYMAFMPGPPATQAQLRAFGVGQSMLGSGLAYANSPVVPRGCTGIDRTDPVFGDRVVKCDTRSRPWDKRYSSFPSMPVYQSAANTLINSERPDLWTLTDPSAVAAVTLDDHEAPDGGFSTTRLEKTGAGTTPSWNQTWSGFFAPGVSFAIWLRADVPHTAYLRLTSNVPPAFDSTVPCVLTTAWQRFDVFASPIAGAAMGSVFIYPVDPASVPATGAVHAWGALISPEPNAASPAEYTVTQTLAQQGGFGPVTALAELPAHGDGYVELAWFNTHQAVSLVPMIKALAAAGRGGLDLTAVTAVFLMTWIATNADGSTAAYDPWDTRVSYPDNLLTDIVLFWTGAGVPGAGTMGMAINGSAPFVLTGQTLPIWLQDVFTLGFDIVTGALPNIIKKFAAGGGPLDADALIAMSTASGVTPLRRVGCIGDSITDGLFHGYYAKSNVLKGLGNGQWIWVDQGMSGNTTAMMLARFPADMVGRGYTDACIMGGINDILFFDLPVATVLANLSAMYALAVADGMTVRALTLTPAKNNTFGNWTAPKQVKIDAVNAAILALYDPNITTAINVYTPLEDPFVPNQGKPSLYEADLLHPNNITSGVTNGQDTMAATVAPLVV
jgi:hypothetical protein